jgi:hypothetical protein
MMSSEFGVFERYDFHSSWEAVERRPMVKDGVWVEETTGREGSVEACTWSTWTGLCFLGGMLVSLRRRGDSQI